MKAIKLSLIHFLLAFRLFAVLFASTVITTVPFESVQAGPNDDDDDDDKDDDDGRGGGATAKKVTGWWQMVGRVNDIKIEGLGFQSTELHKLSPLMRLQLSEPVVFREQEIEMEWKGVGNVKDPDGHFYILASAVKEPPVPWGRLKFNQTIYQKGTKPPFSWEVYRE